MLYTVIPAVPGRSAAVTVLMMACSCICLQLPQDSQVRVHQDLASVADLRTGDLSSKTYGGTLAIVATTIKSVQAIFKKIRDAGFEPEDYISLFNLRSYDRLPDPKIIEKQERESGYTHDQVQAALARLYMYVTCRD